ncbi:polymorphic toxin type 44 domain-containing protein [Paraferrimonas haliotis]|uniref:Bacterial toxin 44 domain-containing protein n=1 Tax=Paraferrimonas haliotis TaxID=2013866 RepID=A0AA37TUU3_9GAMM|nr:polymorphic toxin type 44 domain-containing protein [Paraferrimonas haliotis]GLS83244.1 hypothetical protein GCM10007894_12210 [Paraferrimonas haliotis]
MKFSHFLVTVCSIVLLSFNSANAADNLDCIPVDISGAGEHDLKESQSFENCYIFDDIPENTDVKIAIASVDNVRSKVRLWDMNKPSGQRYITDYHSNSQGTLGVLVNSSNRKLAFSISPLNYLNENKHIRISQTKLDDSIIVVIHLTNIKEESEPTPPPVGGGGTCNNGICQDERSLFVAPLAMQCTSNEQSPGTPSNFNINRNIKFFERLSEALNTIDSSSVSNGAAIIGSAFCSGCEFDLKNNPQYNADEAFGNWFFGAVAATLGFSKDEAVRLAAMAQSYQDNGWSSQMIYNYLNSSGDNSGDPELVIRGYDYKTNIYDADPDNETNSDSCSPQSSNPSNSGLGGGYSVGGGWNLGIWIGFGGCIGDCEIPTGRVTITDLATDPR